MTDQATPAKVRLTDGLGGWEPPKGWTVETPEWLPDCVVTGNSALGWVTVDMRARFFGAGIGKPRRFLKKKCYYSDAAESNSASQSRKARGVPVL